MRDAAKRDDLPARVHEMLCREPSLDRVSLPQVARRFGLSIRTFTRELEAQGASFRVLIESVRIGVAVRELSLGVTSIAELSEQLGYASTQGFHRAFKRWTGTTPARMRKLGMTALHRAAS